MNIKELKCKEFANVEKYASSIASRLREQDDSLGSKIIAAAYLAYLAKKENILTANELINFVDQKSPESQKYFLKDRTSDSYWGNVVEISKEFTSDALLAVVLWYSNNNTGRFSAECETPSSIIKLAYKILNPKNDRVADLCSGVGNFLTFAALQNDECSLYGVDIQIQVKEISEIRLSIFNK